MRQDRLTNVPIGLASRQTDGGAKWTDQRVAGPGNWTGITSSSDGTKLAAIDCGGDIHTSTDGGAKWTDQTSAGSRYWTGITSSSEGTKPAAVVGFNGGDFWTATTQ